MASFTGQVLATTAGGLIGKIPYKLGAIPTQAGIIAGTALADCSSFIQYLFAIGGVALPRKADQQYKATMTGGGITGYSTGTSISATATDTSNLNPGDLLFFGGWDTPDNPPGYGGVQHVGIYVGNGNLVQEGGSTTSSNVNVMPLSAFGDKFLFATRPSTFVQETQDPISGILGALGDAINNIGNTFQDIAVFIGVVLLALVLIIGGVVLLRPQSKE